ncbi:MAG: S8 family peptidase [Christensenellaceae bacterium]|jgi:serine protease AprX|nr:S8 family peptidase [Christensenellaceae bacterium]
MSFDKILNKIDNELLRKVRLCCNEKHSCVVYVTSFVSFRQTIKKSGVGEFFEYPFIKAMGMCLSDSQILMIAKNNNVKYISSGSRVFAQIGVAKKIMHIHHFYDVGIFGNNSTIAIIDTGICPHLDFCVPRQRIVKFVDLINNRAEPYDDNGHGSFVASIACGNGISSGGKFAGIATQANIISIKALEKNGEAGAFKILEAMQWVYDNRRKYNIRVVCMSFGSNSLGEQDPLLLGAEALWNAGIVVVAAAGNSGPDEGSIKSPGTANKIITVGGLNDNRNERDEVSPNNFEVAEFSSRGPAGYYFKPDLVAPATNITGVSKSGSYQKMSGTSVATPMIAGIACLIMDKNPDITPDQLKIRLVRSCRGITQNRNHEGFGLFDADLLFR